MEAAASFECGGRLSLRPYSPSEICKFANSYCKSWVHDVSPSNDHCRILSLRNQLFLRPSPSVFCIAMRRSRIAASPTG